MNDALAERFYVIKWKQPDDKGHSGFDVLPECQYDEFMKIPELKNNIELIKVNDGYEPTLRIRTAQVYKGKCSEGVCA